MKDTDLYSRILGLAPKQREGLEYEFTVVFDLSIDGHGASATKDHSGLNYCLFLIMVKVQDNPAVLRDCA